MNVLIIEPSKLFRSMLSSLFARGGLRVTTATSGEEGIGLVDEQRFDLICIAMHLSDMSGIEFTRLVKSSEHGHRQNVVMVTAEEDAESALSALDAGVVEVFGKSRLDGLLDHAVELVRARLGHAAELPAANAPMANAPIVSAPAGDVISVHDPLTTLYSRDFLSEMAEKFIMDAYRNGYPVSLVTLDLDHFQQVNERYGEAIGDRVLAAVAETVRESCRSGDVAARVDGERFAMLLPHCDEEDAVRKAERMRARVESLRPADLSVTASFGVASLAPEEEGGFVALLGAAESNVRAAKAAGRNRVEWSAPHAGAERLAGERAECFIERADAALYRAKSDGRNRVAAADG